MASAQDWIIGNYQTDNLINEVNRCDISASPLTDHCVISLTLSPGGREKNIIILHGNLTMPFWKILRFVMQLNNWLKK